MSWQTNMDQKKSFCSSRERAVRAAGRELTPAMRKARGAAGTWEPAPPAEALGFLPPLRPGCIYVLKTPEPRQEGGGKLQLGRNEPKRSADPSIQRQTGEIRADQDGRIRHLAGRRPGRRRTAAGRPPHLPGCLRTPAACRSNRTH